jgi:hypothetical protein
MVAIPGPLRSFLRMAGISQQASPDQVLTLLSFNINAHGYEGFQESGRPTEFLILLERYVSQARELSALTGPDGYIRVSDCQQAAPVLKVLGYRVRGECGTAAAAVVTADPDRAFVTIDSGFPLSSLEATVQGGERFTCDFQSTEVPALYSPHDWTSIATERGHDSGDLLDTLLHNPPVARLYFALSRMDPETALALRRAHGLGKLLPFGPELAFYGGQLAIRSGHVVVPGGASAEASWKEIVGTSPSSPTDFLARLISRDRGWLLAYFDALSRVDQSQQQRFTEAGRLQRFYQAFRGPNPSTDAGRPIFRPAPALLLLVTRTQWAPDGQPWVPGNLAVWQEILRRKPDVKIVRHLGKNKLSSGPDSLLEALFALSRSPADVTAVQVYLTVSALDSRRGPGKHLSPETVRAMADRFVALKDQYPIFLEFPELNDASIVHFIALTESLDKIPDHTLRGNAMGIFEANVGLWQILARQDQLPHSDPNDSWEGVLGPFSGITSEPQLYNAGRTALGAILRAATGSPNHTQDEIIELLAGPPQTSPDGQRMHRELADQMRAAMTSQRLVSLDTLIGLGSGLDQVVRGTNTPTNLVPLAHQLNDFEMPKPIFTGNERVEWASGVYNNRHTDLEMRTDVAKILQSSPSRAQLDEARGELAPFLRDSLVGLNYAYYEPPGAQVLRHNPLFVRSHDFAAETVSGYEHVWQAPELFGEGSPAGGGAHLVGSLADLPYVLAETEQDFISPQHVQALIWRAMVPGLLVSATLPRWWDVSRDELHAVGLYQRAGEELLTASGSNSELRERVIAILASRLAPRELAEVQNLMQAGDGAERASLLSATDTFYLAAEYRRRYGDQADVFGPAGRELDALCRRSPDQVSLARISRDFGVPHPVLAQNYAPELLNVRPFPAFEGEASRLQAESWEANNLYWARLADEMGYSPVMLTQLVPELTERMIEKIFATDLEDWPALVRALHETGQEFENGKVASLQSGGSD